MNAQETFSGWRVLIVEDELFVALDLEDMLEGMGCVPLGPVSSVEDALALIGETRPDFALLDENLAGTPATPVAETLEREGIPFVVVSGYSASPSKAPVFRRALRLSKPVTAAAVAAVIRELGAGTAAEGHSGERGGVNPPF